MRYIIFAVFLIAGCSSLSKQAFENIREGDSANHLQETLGTPRWFAPSIKIQGAQAWYYTRRSEQCAFTIKDNIVQFMSCGVRPGYVNPLAAMASGMGNGLSHAQDRTVSCTSYESGGMIYSTCR